MKIIYQIKKYLLHLFFIPLTLLWCYPFIWMVSSSFKTQQEMFMNGLRLIPQNPTLDNVVRAWKSAKFELYFFNTVIVTIFVVAIVLIVASTSGYALGRGNMPGKKIIIACLIATMFLPKSVTILPIFHLINRLGLNNSLFGVILAEAGPAHVMAILLFASFFAGIPNELEESALLDGTKYPRIFVSIMLPLAKPVIATVGIFNFVGAWNEFLAPLVFTLNKPSLRTLGVGMYSFFGEQTVDWTGLAAGAMITVIPIIIIFLLFQKFFIEGLEGAVKG